MDSLNVMILGVKKYSFEDDKTKRMVEGVSVHYVQLAHSNEEDKVGYFPTKASFSDLKVFEQFRGHQFPLQAKASITFDLTARNPIKVTGFHELETILVD